MSKTENIILQIILNNPYIKRVEIVDQTNFSRAKVDRALASLKAKNILKRIGYDKTGHWEILI